jgi:hypothetical protein
MRTRAILHVGPNKTGSSSMVNFMNAAKGRLPSNVIYPGEDFGFRSHFKAMRHNWDLSRVNIDKASGSPSFVRPETATAMENLVAHMRGMEEEEVSAVFVCESLSRASQEIEMSALLSEYFDEVVIVKIARKQDDLLASVIVQYAKSWTKRPNSLSWKKFSSQAASIDFMDFEQSLSRWEAVEANYPSVRYEFIPFLESDPGTENLLRRFFEVTQLTGMPEGVIKPGLRINSSIGASAVEKLVSFKRWDRLVGWIPKVHETFLAKHAEVSRQALTEISSHSRKNDNDDPVRVWRINPQGCREILAHYLPSNRSFVTRVNQNGLTDEWHAWAVSVEELVS